MNHLYVGGPRPLFALCSEALQGQGELLNRVVSGVLSYSEENHQDVAPMPLPKKLRWASESSSLSGLSNESPQ